MEGLIDSWATIMVTFFLIAILIERIRKGKTAKKSPDDGLLLPILPSPPKYPILGHLHLLNGVPFIQMTKLAENYGEIYYLQLGVVNTVVVSSLSLIKEILVEKGSDFGDRANFLRYHVLFGDDKENSLAFCNWSLVQKTRRSLARRFCHSGIFTDRVDETISKASSFLIKNLHESLESGNLETKFKFILNKTCANVFFGFFCSEFYFDDDSDFDLVVTRFDEIFWEINQSHPTDVLPILTPFFRRYLKNLANMGKDIRKFVLERIINPHMKNLDNEKESDFVDILLSHLENPEEKLKLSLTQVLYELEDFLGGHSAVSNLLARILIEIASVEGLSQKIYKKCILEGNNDYLQALVYETLRKSSSPIVPHVASKDSYIAGYPIKAGTMIILNNYDLNTNEKYWREPEKFIPERFLTEAGAFRKPSYFLPFSLGRRACMGYRLVEKISQGIIKAIIEHFNISDGGNPTKIPIACVALEPNFKMNVVLTPRINTLIDDSTLI